MRVLEINPYPNMLRFYRWFILYTVKHLEIRAVITEWAQRQHRVGRDMRESVFIDRMTITYQSAVSSTLVSICSLKLNHGASHFCVE